MDDMTTALLVLICLGIGTAFGWWLRVDGRDLLAGWIDRLEAPRGR